MAGFELNMIGTNQLLCYEFYIVQVYLKKYYDLLYCPKIYHKSIIILLQWLVVFLSVISIVSWAVECPLWKPNWFSFSMLWLSGKLNNLLYINFFFILWKVFKLVGFEMFNIISINSHVASWITTVFNPCPSETNNIKCMLKIY